MESALSHEDCSQLLPLFLDEHLDAARTEAVAAHLRSCEGCRQEEAALRALLAEPGPNLSHEERTALHAALARARARPPGEVVNLTPPARRSWAARFAPTLGAAALLVIVAVAVLQSGDGGSSGGAGAGTATENASRASSAAKAGGELGARPRWLGDQGKATLTDVVSKARTHTAASSLRGLADQPSPATAEPRLVDALAAQAPARLRASLRSCIDEIASSSGDPMLPVVGAEGVVDGRRVLFVGFVTHSGNRRSGKLTMWALSRGSCDVVGYQLNALER